MKILVIDDAPVIRLKVAHYLAKKHSDIQLVLAENGEEGLKLFSAGEFDAVFTDRNLPGILGEEVVREMRRKDSRVKIFLMSAASEEEKAKLKELIGKIGADGFIDKLDQFLTNFGITITILKSL